MKVILAGFALCLISLTSASSFASGIKCDGNPNYKGALEINGETVGNPARGHGFTKHTITLNDRNIAQYFVDNGGIYSYLFHSTWNDNFFSTSEVNNPEAGVFTANITNDYGTEARKLVVTLSGSTAKLQSFELNRSWGGSSVQGRELASWNFASCTTY